MQPDEVPQWGMHELRHVYAELAEVSKDYHEARQQANLDKLTGLYNRRFFDERVNRLLLEHQPFCLAMIDLDDFKRVNDTYGHQTGDVVLKRVANLGAKLLEDHRLGLPLWWRGAGGAAGQPGYSLLSDAAGAVQDGVASLDWREPGLGITFSGGLVASAPGLDAKELLDIVDAEVYRAKRDGKNRIYLGGSLPRHRTRYRRQTMGYSQRRGLRASSSFSSSREPLPCPQGPAQLRGALAQRGAGLTA